ncbi:unnamed protein product [Clavelina lepadiformis]|uniref:BTB domain-containing protein n=1 Tax=Clavelina lepadiformis TaxID=159417 RepID=A0ABP0GMC2_CLALP
MAQMKENFENEVSIKGVSSDMMALMMDFIYTCKLRLNIENGFGLLAAYEQLQIPYKSEY